MFRKLMLSLSLVLSISHARDYSGMDTKEVIIEFLGKVGVLEGELVSDIDFINRVVQEMAYTPYEFKEVREADPTNSQYWYRIRNYWDTHYSDYYPIRDYNVYKEKQGRANMEINHFHANPRFLLEGLAVIEYAKNLHISDNNDYQGLKQSLVFDNLYRQLKEKEERGDATFISAKTLVPYSKDREHLTTHYFMDYYYVPDSNGRTHWFMNTVDLIDDFVGCTVDRKGYLVESIVGIRNDDLRYKTQDDHHLICRRYFLHGNPPPIENR